MYDGICRSSKADPWLKAEAKIQADVIAPGYKGAKHHVQENKRIRFRCDLSKPDWTSKNKISPRHCAAIELQACQV